MYCEAIPDFAADFFAEQVREGFAAMDVQVIQHQMNGFGMWILDGQIECHSGERNCQPVRRGVSEVTSGLGLNRAENVSGTAPLVFTVPSGFAAWLCRREGADFTVKCDVIGFSSRHSTGSTGL